MDVVGRIWSMVTLAGLPRAMQIGIYGLAGVVAGMALLLARVSNATSYLSDDPLTCINCHVMTDAYASWQRGSHRQAAVCVDCHVPHGNLVAKYAFKGRDGLRHSYVFTRGTQPQVLELSAGAGPVVQSNCVRCHDHQIMMVLASLLQGAPAALGLRPGQGGRGQDGLATQGRDALATRCWDCHQNIHGEVRSLSASPAELRPGLPAAGLDWMKPGE
ncbi:MAG: hypothetical protein A2Y77_07650 [Planctomycetes bacterium RBG_13_62_9]|nr:MAG: hypothetical protein A2Y77_07650 [Planctomycetes bacterium RBG_13_62_9]